jgi:hypothetical protein
MTAEKDFELLCDLLSPLTQNLDINVKWQFNMLTQADWGALVKRASGHLVTPSLYCMCRNKGLLPRLPEDLQDYLESIYLLNLERNQALREQAIEVVGLLNQVGIEPILLKGIASLLTDLYPDFGMRVLGDIDILVSPESLSKAEAILRANGYTCAYESSQLPKGFYLHHHINPLRKKDRPTTIELHRKLTSFSPHGELLNSKDHWQSAQALTVENARCLVLSPEGCVLHNFYHTQIQDQNFFYGRIQLRQLLEGLWLNQRYDAQINWVSLLDDINKHHLLTPFRAYLLNAQIYFKQSLDESFSPTFAANLQIKREQVFRCNPLLRHYACIMLYGILGLYQLFSPQLIRFRHGDVSLLKGCWLRLLDLCSPRWYLARINAVRQLGDF